MSPLARSGLLGGVLIAGAVMPARTDHAPAQSVSFASSGWPIDDFALADQHGNPFTQDRLRGRWTLLLLGDSRCGEPCTSALAALSGLYRRIAATKALETTQVVFLSLDPRDTPAELARYLASYDPRFLGATGPREVLAGIEEDLGVSRGSTSGQAPPATGSRNCDGSIGLIAPDGVLRSRQPPPFDVPTLTAEYLKTRVRR
jgi:protein SCO1/2